MHTCTIGLALDFITRHIRFVMLLKAIHVELWAAYAVVMNVHYILIMLVKVSFQCLIPNQSYNKTCDLENQP